MWRDPRIGNCSQRQAVHPEAIRENEMEKGQIEKAFNLIEMAAQWDGNCRNPLSEWLPLVEVIPTGFHFGDDGCVYLSDI
jgi:hypothetical protein